MKRVFNIILAVLAAFLFVFLTHGIYFLLIRHSDNMYQRLFMQNEMLHLFIPFGFSLFSLILICALMFSNRRMEKQEQDHDGLFKIYQSVFDGMKTGLMVLDSENRIRFINPVCCQMLERDPASVPELAPFTSILKPVLEPVAERLSEAVEKSEPFSREFRVYLSGGVRCIYCDFYAFYNTRFGRISVLTLTDRTKEDEIRQKLSLQLEETHRHAVAKDNFFANMSHEIRTPINAILGMTYFAKTMTKDKKCVEYIQKIENASDLLLGVVNDILDFSKMQEHKFVLNPEDFNLFDLKKILQDLFSLKAEQKDLLLQVNFDIPEVYFVKGDQFRLTQIFMNLVGNAIKFTDRGFVSISLNHEELGQEVILRCTVRDSGIGLSEEETTKLFTDFEQFGKVLVKSHEGTGLGLAICKRLVELMRGVIWVDSNKGKGSSFHFVVVLSKSERVNVLPPDERLPKIQLVSRRVLLVEDNEINAEIAAALLEDAHCYVDRASDGIEAIEECRKHSGDYYDLILMDIHMPRMNGYEAARVIRNDLNVTCPIFAVTATSEDNAILEANRDIISNYILKPYNPGVFRDIFGE